MRNDYNKHALESLQQRNKEPHWIVFITDKYLHNPTLQTTETKGISQGHLIFNLLLFSSEMLNHLEITYFVWPFFKSPIFKSGPAHNPRLLIFRSLILYKLRFIHYFSIEF